MDAKQGFLTALLRHEQDVKAFIGSIVRDPHVRDDVFQEVALTLWERFDEYDPQRSFGAWARGIAAKKVLQRRHQDQRFPTAFSPQTVQAVLEAFDRTEHTTSARAEAFQKCVESLPPPSRELLRLRYGEGLKVAQLAERINRTVTAVFQALCRVRAKLADCIRRRMAAEERD